MSKKKYQLQTFNSWIKGFEERYSENKLWHMKWIWNLVRDRAMIIIRDLEFQRDEWEKAAIGWEEEYQKLKDKYEPEVVSFNG